MPFQAMADAVAGQAASSVEYNKVVDNVEYVNQLVNGTGNPVFTTQSNVAAWALSAQSSIDTLSTGHYARYYTSLDVNMSNANADVLVPFDTALHTSSDVTASGTGNTTFKLNKAGVWEIAVGVRGKGVAVTATGEMVCAITNGGTSAASRYLAENKFRASGQTGMFALIITRRFAVNDLIGVTYKHDTGNNVAGVINGAGAGEQTAIALTWIRA